MKKTENVKSAVKADATKVAATVKAETAKTAAAVKTEATKAAAAAKTETVKAAKAVKKAVKRTPAKKTTPKTDLYIQFADREYTQDAIIKLVKEVWTKQMKKKIGDMKSLQIYVKPEEFAAYYVINGDVVGRVEL